ncbi:pectate lyase superfamily protein domain-containing protein [Trichoderma breve]|uniref:Pectate lyase superfamily protein domain-containing protein n=1 Tax=Trichoderma breve TaxID=2034170 RepID=A0A9W9BLZ7_9HYPO|nr:pectate lyase superfamily protein domain-containing protein [Trichoderma breve]KAJ4862845.1 pectate lyase superfamily protein domain-containing protein [Trichoderma breve]
MLKLTALVALLLGAASATPTPSPPASDEGITKRATSFYYPNMDHVNAPRGFAPDLDGDFNYPIYQTVNSGDGNALQNAINTDGKGGSRHPQWFASQPRVVYIPPGTYTISKTLRFNTDTILMGDPTNPPIIKAAAGFSGDQTLISAQDPSTNEKGELSFAVAIKNLVLDTTAIPGGNSFTALWWGVAQAAHLQNVRITMSSSSGGNGHTGIRMGRGSTLGLADVRVERGQNGMLISGGNTFSIFSSTFDTCGTGISNTGGSPWIALIDAKSINSGVTFTTTQFPSFMIENLTKDNGTPVVVARGSTLVGASSHVNTYSYGNTVGRNPTYGDVTSSNTRPGALAPGGRYPYVAPPTYGDLPISSFLNVKDPAQNGGRTVKGDNTIDEAPALNAILELAASQNKVAYFPFGKYRVDSTLFIPKGSRIVGEAWATITGNGNFFKNENSPQPVVSVGRAGDVGIAQIQDMRFTVNDVLSGAIVVQFNMAGNNPGDVALWNSLVTVGGTRGASALANACTNNSNECKGAFIGIHVAKGSSPYIQNVWNWVADHIAENFSGGTSIAGKGGILVQSTKATWLYAIGSEHWWLYQLNLHNAANVVVSLLQAETNYHQGANTQQIPPAPWVANIGTWGDPDFAWCNGGDKRCRMGPANFINGGSNIYTYASAAWAFFSGPGQGCAQFECQQTMHWIASTPSNLQAFGLCSKDSVNTLRLGDGTFINTQNGYTGGWTPGGGDVGRYTT